jgi:uncharacterized protein (TIGR00255 family)
MVMSMTGFGRGESADSNYKVTVEMKSVNHRYLDVALKMPKKLNMYEAELKNILKEYAKRGKIDIYITYECTSDADLDIEYNPDAAKRYLEIFDEMSKIFGITNDVTVSTLARCPEVVSTKELEPEDDELYPLVETAFRQACEMFMQARAQEGTKLAENIMDKLDYLMETVDFINAHNDEIMRDYRTKLENKVKELLGEVNIDESRIATELVLYADKVCVDEEIVRLRSHIESMRKEFCTESAEGIGRKLDFIAQEMNREANTTLSKANNIMISERAISLKTEIEKIREQVQNIE